MEKLYIVIWRAESLKVWHAESSGVFPERRLAANFIECALAGGSSWEYAIVEGPIVSPQEMKAIEEKLSEV